MVSPNGHSGFPQWSSHVEDLLIKPHVRMMGLVLWFRLDCGREGFVVDGLRQKPLVLVRFG